MHRDKDGVKISDLVCLAFKDVVVRDGDGKIHLKQSVNLVAIGASRGASFGMLMGTLVGILFMNPLAGLLVGGVAGAGSGALQGKLADYGIDNSFVNSLGSTIEPNSSVIFLLVRKAVEDG